MKILITGASGFIGFHLLTALLKIGHDVIGCSRRAKELRLTLPSAQWLSCDFENDTTEDCWIPRLENVDLVVNAVGIIEETFQQSFNNVQTHTPIALFDAANTLNIKVIQISALGADDPQVTVPFLRSKLLADNHLNQLPVESITVHPSIVIGRGGTSTALFSAMAALPITPLIANGQQKIQPIHIDDLTSTLLHMIEHWPGGKHRHQLMGAEVMSMRQLYTTLRDWMQLPSPTFCSVPMPLLRIVAKCNEKLGGSGLLTQDTLDLLENAKTPEPSYLKTPPRPIKEALWLNPASPSDTWYARLQWIHPLMFWSITFIWIFTGLTSAFFDRASGYELMASGGIYGWQAGLAINGGALIDITLGLLMVRGRHLPWIYSLQIMMMLMYMIGICFIAPEQWLHPFGPVTKNFPLIAGTLFLLVTHPAKYKRYLMFS